MVRGVGGSTAPPCWGAGVGVAASSSSVTFPSSSLPPNSCPGGAPNPESDGAPNSESGNAPNSESGGAPNSESGGGPKDPGTVSSNASRVSCHCTRSEHAIATANVKTHAAGSFMFFAIDLKKKSWRSTTKVSEMFCELFGVSSAGTTTSKKTKSKSKHVGTPQPSRSDQQGAPFVVDEVDESLEPEPTDLAPQLEYQYIRDEWSDADADADDFSGDEIENYDGCTTSITDETSRRDMIIGSIESSPGFFERREPKEKNRPLGIAVTFDDDSWID